MKLLVCGIVLCGPVSTLNASLREFLTSSIEGFVIVCCSRLTVCCIVLCCLLFCFVLFCLLDPGLGSLAFAPADGLLKVGGDTRIVCILTGANASSNGAAGQFNLVDVGHRSDLLSTNVTSLPVHVQPPTGHATYPLYGSTVIRCSYEDSRGRRLEKTLTVRILRKLAHSFSSICPHVRRVGDVAKCVMRF